MVKWIAAEDVGPGLLQRIIYPNITGRAKERIAQSKLARTGLLATVD